jgi:poly(U)-specific endoribonuclease
MADIYQELWNSDTNGLSVSLRKGDGWQDPDADILLDVQVEAGGKRGIDLAARPLFHKVKEEKLETPTYKTFIRLLDNYITRVNDTEILEVKEQQEIDAFLDAILPTKPIQLAWKYINQELGETFSEKQFRAKLQRVWFELYTNYYQGRATHFCSGFEHVFVGEAKLPADFRQTRNGTLTLGEISGYHSWVKFYSDEQFRNVNFLGYKYDLGRGIVPQTPNVITLQMTQNITNTKGEVVAQLFKQMGGFFVGSSPECEIAMGTVAFFESVHNQLKKDRRRTTVNGAIYDLVMYRNITPNGSRGEFVRSFYPEFLGNEGTQPPREDEIDRPDVVVVPLTLKNDGPVIIVRALPNPKGADEGTEWVELKNVTNAPIDLTNWEMRDQKARPEPVSGILQPDQVERFTITRSNPNAMQLTNKPGTITLHDGQGQLIASVNYSSANSGEITQFA